MKLLTAKQERVFKFIKHEIMVNHMPPSIREVGEQFRISVKAAYDHIAAIERKGYISKTPKKMRSIRLM